ncbi:hypothetical protein E2C01_097923 [Portunus trituberculatus]|uniref:Uncharacterized protein n=1 Tax=Portunus trituberculatus TaxID=210409 RepID=A0A5B7K652_PORTR|nr:hypothetical protein [Portunus trituberculatus]
MDPVKIRCIFCIFLPSFCDLHEAEGGRRGVDILAVPSCLAALDCVLRSATNLHTLHSSASPNHGGKVRGLADTYNVSLSTLSPQSPHPRLPCSTLLLCASPHHLS